MLSPARVQRSHETIGAIYAAHTRGQAGTPVTVRSSPEPHTEGQFCPWAMTTLGWNRGHSQQEAADRVLHAPTSLPPASPRFSRAARHPTAGASGLELRPDRAWPN